MDNEKLSTMSNDENIHEDIELNELNPSKWKKFVSKITNSPYLFLLSAFFLPFLIMLGAHAALRFFPFGNQSILSLDFQAQYIYYFGAVRKLLTEGGSWLYTWSRTLGGEFMGYVTYYMGSPFNLLIVLFPEKHLAMAASFVVLVKIGAMGVTMAYYLHKNRKFNDISILIFSTMYALCGYVPVQQYNPMWLDALIWLPLVILGVETIVKDGKPLMYIISLTLAVTSNYYIGYMCCIFTGIYFICYYIMVRPELLEKHPPKGESIDRILSMHGLKTFVIFFLSTVVMLLMSAFALICAYYSLTFGKSTFSSPNWAFSLKFDYLDLFVKMLTGSYDTVRPNGLPNIYSGMLSLALLPVFYCSKAISTRKKVVMSTMLTIILFSFLINPVDLVWHGFSSPNWLDYRFSFVFSFVVILMASEAFENFKEVNFKVFGVTSVAIIFLIFIVQKLNYTFEQGTKKLELSDLLVILISLVAISLYFGVMYALHTTKKQKENSVLIALAVLVSLELFANAATNIGQFENDVGVVRYNNYLASPTNKVERYDSYVGSVERMQLIYKEIIKNDKSFFRTESTIYRQTGGVNEQMSVGFNGISSSTSTLNKKVIRLMEKLGYSSSSHWTKYLGGTPIADSLLGIKYVLTTDRPTEGNGGTIQRNNTHSFDKNFYIKAYEIDEPDRLVPSDYKIFAMQNTKALPIAYAVSRNVLSMENVFNVDPYYTAMDLQNQLINNMVSESLGYEPNVFKPLTTKYTYSHASVSVTNIGFKWDGESQNTKYYVVTKVADNPTITFKTTAVADGVVYFHFPTVNFGKTCKVYVNGEFITNYFGLETTCAMELGTFKTGDSISVELQLDSDKLYMAADSESFFWYVDVNAMNTAFDYLEEASLYIEKYGNSKIEGYISAKEGQELVFTTIPYDKGWNVYVDGKKVETVETLDALLAFEITSGDHEIKLNYFPVQYKIGLIASAVGFIIFALMLVYKFNPKFKKIVDARIKDKDPDENATEDDSTIEVEANVVEK